jgi:hypothetical protein
MMFLLIIRGERSVSAIHTGNGLQSMGLARPVLGVDPQGAAFLWRGSAADALRSRLIIIGAG